MRTIPTSLRLPSPRVLSACLAIGMAGSVAWAPARADSADGPQANATQTNGARHARGLTEIPDPELMLMRGRYTVGNNAVAWFGVTMVSSWQTATGQTMLGTLTFGMDFSKPGQVPVITFTPTVTITDANAPMPGTTDGLDRSVDASGLANVSGVVQSVQVAGDGNSASNVASLTVRNGSAPGQSPAGGSSGTGVQTAHAGNATATAGFDGSSANVLLQIQGQGAVEQWIRNGSLGQTVQLTSDNQTVSNHLQVELVREALASNTQLVQNVGQALQLARGIGSPGM